jgi:hypothetical protein
MAFPKRGWWVALVRKLIEIAVKDIIAEYVGDKEPAPRARLPHRTDTVGRGVRG